MTYFNIPKLPHLLNNNLIITTNDALTLQHHPILPFEVAVNIEM